MGAQLSYLVIRQKRFNQHIVSFRILIFGLVGPKSRVQRSTCIFSMVFKTVLVGPKPTMYFPNPDYDPTAKPKRDLRFEFKCCYFGHLGTVLVFTKALFVCVSFCLLPSLVEAAGISAMWVPLVLGNSSRNADGNRLVPVIHWGVFIIIIIIFPYWWLS